MVTALNRVQGSPLISSEDKAGIEHYKVILKDKQDELAGLNGYQRVPDAQLDAFANYVVQDMEQASQNITISLVTLLLIIIIVIRSCSISMQQTFSAFVSEVCSAVLSRVQHVCSSFSIVAWRSGCSVFVQPHPLLPV
jgi:hypothetical protein